MILISSSGGVISCLGGRVGISPGGSFSRTEAKKLERTSACSCSLSVTVLSGFNNGEIPVFVFNLDLMYFHSFLGLSFAFLLSSLSYYF